MHVDCHLPDGVIPGHEWGRIKLVYLFWQALRNELFSKAMV